MALPEVLITVTDPNLGIVPAAIDSITAAIGNCSAGATGTVYSFADKQAVIDTIGYGPLSEYICHVLDVAGGPVYAVKAADTVAGSAGAITKSAAGSPTVTVAGAAYDAFQVILEVLSTGDRGVATFKYSLDNGDTYSPEIVIPAGGTYVLANTNLTLTFPAKGGGDPYTDGNTYTFACTAPLYDATSLATAFDTLTADPREWKFVKIVGQATNAANAATLAATVKTKIESASTVYRYARAFMDSGDEADAAQIAAFASFESARVVVCAGFQELVSSVSGRIYKRPSGWSASARAARAPVQEDLGRVASGSTPGTSSLIRDERATPGLDVQRFCTARSFIGLAGYYITAGRTMASQVSDYQYVQNGFVIDKACRAVRTALLRYLNDEVRVNATTGYIYEPDAQAIEAAIKAQVEAFIVAPGNAVSVDVRVSRTENILSTSTLPVTVSVVPFGYARSITADVGLKNPALTPVAA